MWIAKVTAWEQKVLKCSPHFFFFFFGSDCSSGEASAKNKPRLKLCWLHVPCNAAAYCWCANPLNPQEAVHTLSFTDVCITTVGRGARASQRRHFSVARSHRCRVRPMRREKGGGKKRGKIVADMLWLDESERNHWASFFRLDGSCDWPHTGSLLPYPITSYNFGFVLCLSCHNTKMTRQHETEHSSLNKAYFHIPPFFFSLLSFPCFCLCFLVSITVSYPHDLSAREQNLFTSLSIQSASKRSQQYTEPDPNAVSSEFCKLHPLELAVHGVVTATRHCSCLAGCLCFIATCISAIKRELVVLWPPCASCSALVAALLQHCFDLTPLVFREQISLFCSHQGRLCDLTRWKMLSRGEGSPFSSYLNSLFFPFSAVTSRHTLYYGLLLVEMHIYLSIYHWFVFISVVVLLLLTMTLLQDFQDL